VTSFEMQPMRARFANQDQAESAIRKLAALRGDRFRLERAGGAFGASRIRPPRVIRNPRTTAA